MDIILSALIVFTFVLFVMVFIYLLHESRHARKDEFFEKVIERVSSLINSKVSLVPDLQNAGPWYLVVYTKDSDYPIWVSNNNIRSVHPDPKNRKIIIKQFNGEDMVIENVENYEMRAANKMFDYDM